MSVALLASVPAAGLAAPADATPQLATPWWLPEWLAHHDRDGDRVDDEAESVASAEGSVGVVVVYGRTATAADAALLGDAEAYVFRHAPLVTARVDAARLGAIPSFPGVLAVEYDHPVVPLLETSAPATQARDHHQQTGANAVYNGRTAQTLGYDGTGTVVAVLDTGVANGHPAFAGKYVAGANVVAQAIGCIDSPDDDGHGTHVAGTAVGAPAASNHKGTATGARLVEIKISASAGVTSATIGGIERGFDWILDYNAAIDAGAPLCGVSPEDRIDVATVSFGSTGRGGPSAGSTETLVDQLTRSGVVVTIAVGNCGPTPSSTCSFGDDEFGISSPGNAAGAIGVANSNDGGTVNRLNDVIAGSSSRGPNSGSASGLADLKDRHRKPEITGPGTNIMAPDFLTAGYVSKSGTSMSTPHLAGVAALLLQAGEDAKAETGGVNLMAPTGPGYDASGNHVFGEHPVRDALVHGASYSAANVPADMLSKWEGPGAGGRTWNNAWGYGHANAFDALCWAWANVLQPGGATPSAVVADLCALGSLPLAVSAGGPYAARVGASVTLEGLAVGGTGAYAYAWSVTSAPAGSTAAPVPASVRRPTFVPDLAGAYTLQLTVSDGVATATDAATLVATQPDAQGCGGDGVNVATDPGGDGPSGARDALCLGVDDRGATIDLRAEVMDKTALGGEDLLYYDFYFTPSFGLAAGEEQLVEVAWDGATADVFWSLPPPATYTPDPSKTPTATFDGNVLVVSLPTSDLGAPADGDRLDGMRLDVNHCEGTTCTIVTDDLVPDSGGASFEFQRVAGGDGREVPLGTDPSGDHAAEACDAVTGACTPYGAAADLVRVGAGDDDERVYFFATVADIDAFQSRFYVNVDFVATWANDQEYSAIVSVDGVRASAAVGLYTSVSAGGVSGGPRTSTDLTTSWSGETLRIGVRRADVGLPPDGGVVADLAWRTQTPTTSNAVRLDDAGPVAEYALGTPAPDTTPPTAPTGLVAFDAGTGDRIDLGWTAATDDAGVVLYNVYRGTSSGVTPATGTLAGTSTAPAFSDAGLANGATYWYVVTAEDAAGNEGPASNEASATVTGGDPDTTPPTAFTLAAADLATDGEVRLDWTAATDPESGVGSYAVHRGATSGFAPDATNLVATLPGTATQYVDGGLANGVPVHYVVVATNGEGLSTASNEASATPTFDTAAPPQVTGVTAVPSSRRVSVAWDASPAGDIARYDLYRDGAFRESTAVPGFLDTGLVNGVEYCYTVVAVDARGNVAPASAPACATPEAPDEIPVLGWPQFRRDPAQTGASPVGAVLPYGPKLLGLADLAGAAANPVVGDVDGDGHAEIVLALPSSTGDPMRVLAFDVDRTLANALVPKWSAALPVPTLPATNGGVVATPVLVDTGDGDAEMEIVVAYTYLAGAGVSAIDPALAVLDGDGTVVQTLDVPYVNARNSPVVANLDEDDTPEIVLTTQPSTNTNGDEIPGTVQVFDVAAGGLGPLWSAAFPSVNDAGTSAPAVADLDGDGVPEIAAAYWSGNTAGGVLLASLSGGVLAAVPLPLAPWGVAVGDLDGDGTPEIVGGSRQNSAAAGSLFVLDSTTGPAGYGLASSAPVGYLWNTPAVGDVTGDGLVDIVVANHGEFLNDLNRVGDVRVFGYGGGGLVERAHLPRAAAGVDHRVPGGPVLADLDGDGVLDVLVASMAGDVEVYDGALARLWSWKTGPSLGAVAVADAWTNAEADVVLVARGLMMLGSDNRIPVLAPVADQTVAEAQALAVTVAASDPDGDAVALSTGSLPAGASFTDHGDGTGTFSWTPTYRQAGLYEIAVHATDGRARVSEAFLVDVTNVNTAPVLAAVGDLAASEGAELVVGLSATDAEGDALVFFVEGAPCCATLEPATGVFRWTPSFDQAGAYAVTFGVGDGEAQDTETVTVTVADVNRAPVLAPVGAKSVDVYAHKRISFTVSATDPDGDALAYAASGLPAGASFSPANRTFWWYPTAADAGTHTVRFAASDGALEDAEDVAVTVTADAKPRVAVATLHPSLRETSPGVPTTLAFSVRNDGLATQTFALSATGPTTWSVAPSSPTVTLGPGQSATVTVTVVPSAGQPYASLVTLRAASHAVAASAQGHVRVPVILDLAMDFDTFYLSTPVSGVVTGRYLDGSPASGALIEVAESSSVAGYSVGITRRALFTLGDDGAAPFVLKVDVAAANAPGEHVVRARTLHVVNHGSADAERYVVL